MRLHITCAVALFPLVSTSWAGPETTEVRLSQAKLVPMVQQAPRAWLGIHIEKPDESITAHIPLLPQGIGFVVKEVESGGPSETAGMTPYDLIWKFGDQMLVNEAQMAALLRLHQPGEELSVAVFRGGKPVEVKVRLGEAPLRKNPRNNELLESAVMPGACAVPMRVVNIAEKSASFADDEGKGTVRRSGDGYRVEIRGPNHEPIFEGDLAKDDSMDQVPEDWRRKTRVLCRSLDQALDGETSSVRQPRPRVVPPAPASH